MGWYSDSHRGGILETGTHLDSKAFFGEQERRASHKVIDRTFRNVGPGNPAWYSDSYGGEVLETLMHLDSTVLVKILNYDGISSNI